jgi:hypothetical protein
VGDSGGLLALVMGLAYQAPTPIQAAFSVRDTPLSQWWRNTDRAQVAPCREDTTVNG